MVDIHPCGASERGRMMMPKPFQIPMSTLLPREPINFLPAGKNIGVTHLTNGAFRLHPVEWMVGEAAGTIAALAIAGGSPPAASRRPGRPRPLRRAAGLVRRSAGRSSGFRRDPAQRSSRLVPFGRGPARVARRTYHARRSCHGSRHLPREQAIREAIDQGWMAVGS